MSKGIVSGLLAKGFAGAVAENFGKKETKPTTDPNKAQHQEMLSNCTTVGRMAQGDNLFQALKNSRRNRLEHIACAIINTTTAGRMIAFGENPVDAYINSKAVMGSGVIDYDSIGNIVPVKRPGYTQKTDDTQKQ